MIAATAAEATMTSATTARLTAQRTRPPFRGGLAGGATGLAGTGPDAQATSCSKPVGGVAGLAGVSGAVGGTACAAPGVVSDVGTRLVTSSAAGVSIVGSRSSVIVVPFAGSTPARQCADGCPFAAAGQLLHEFLHLGELLHQTVDVRQCRP